MLSTATFSTENPTTENRRVRRPVSRLFSELELRQYETVDQSAGDFAFLLHPRTGHEVVCTWPIW